MFLISFCALPSLLITLPRYVKQSTHSSDSPATVRVESKVVLIHITFVFVALIVLPNSLRLTTVKLAHEDHHGICKTKARLRAKVWFPNNDTLVDEEVYVANVNSTVLE